jgi:hypothetical protein
MHEPFAAILAVGGKANSLGRANEVTETVLGDHDRLEELYQCLFADDAWVRMRAADSLEKICRVHPDWLAPYIDRIAGELASSEQASIQWHIAQIYRQVSLTPAQKAFAILWLKARLASTDVDWIVAANVLDTLAQFTRDGAVPESELRRLIAIQQTHRSKSVVRRASKLLDTLAEYDT